MGSRVAVCPRLERPERGAYSFLCRRETTSRRQAAGSSDDSRGDLGLESSEQEERLSHDSDRIAEDAALLLQSV